MKTIGLLGGTSWPSTMEYYRILNQLTQAKLGELHSANVLLKSIEYFEIRQHYHEGWDKIPSILKRHLEALAALGPDCILLCNNQLHKAYDIIEKELALKVPFFHIAELTAQSAKEQKYKQVLLLGTKFTMEDGFYARRFEERRISVVIPTTSEREKIQRIQSQVAVGKFSQKFEIFFDELINAYQGVDAVVLACTELP